jgi:hypothetical protein
MAIMTDEEAVAYLQAKSARAPAFTFKYRKATGI